MKKSRIRFIMALILLILTGCNSNDDTQTVKNGTYIMVHEAESIFTPSVTISDSTISFSFDPLNSYWPHGSYSIEEDILTMTTDDNRHSYVFHIDGDDLIFQKDGSASVRLIDKRAGAQVTDQSEFQLVDE